jgi:hypothetical protein
MHDSVLSWGDRIVASYQLALRPTLEVGSLDVNGSLRRFFGGPYFGVDTRVGPGVDVVASAGALPFETTLGRWWCARRCSSMTEVVSSSRGPVWPISQIPAMLMISVGRARFG